MKFIDWFAGVGGFRRGLELAGHECVGFCEYDKFAVASYTSMHLITDEQRAYLATLPFKDRQKEILKEEYRNGEWYASDIRTVDYRDVPRADIWCFGAPCQDFSIAGSRSGLQGDRSSLVRRVFDLVRQTDPSDRPKWLIYENVKGMLSSNKGRDYLAILMEMDDIGYDIEWQMLDTANFGIPQHRERIYTVGCLRRDGISTPKVFPVSGTDTKAEIHIIGHRDGFRRNTQTYDPDGITETIDTAGGGGREMCVACFETGYTGMEARPREYEKTAPTVRGRDYKDPLNVGVKIDGN